MTTHEDRLRQVLDWPPGAQESEHGGPEPGTGGACYVPTVGQHRRVQLGDGVAGSLTWLITDHPTGIGLNQSLCVRQFHGLQITIGVRLYHVSQQDRVRAAAAGYSSAVTIYRHLRFPPSGTTHPLG